MVQRLVRSRFLLIVPVHALFCTVALFALLSPVRAESLYERDLSDITVTTAQDELNEDGDCSLREAIQASNSDGAIDACPAGNGNDTIHLPAATYTLTLEGNGEDGNQTGDLDILGTVVLSGAEIASTIIDGGEIDRVAHVHAGARVIVKQVSIVNGRAPEGVFNEEQAEGGADGGGILNEGTLSLINVEVRNNLAGQGGMGYKFSDNGYGGNGGESSIQVHFR